MKRWQILPGRIAYLLLMLCFQFIAISAQARSLKDIIESGELRICISPYHPSTATVEPANCRQHCQFNGPVYDETLAFAQTLNNVHTKFIRVEWDEQFFNKDGKTVIEASYTPELLASKTCDFYPSNLTKNEWRLKKLDFVTLFPSRMMLIVQKSRQAEFKTIADLAGKTVAVEKDTSFHTWLQQQNETTFVAKPVHIDFMETFETAQAVEDGKVDFAIADADQAIWSTRKLKNAAVAFPIGAPDEIGWAFRKQDKDLQKAVQIFFDVQRKNADSSFNQIWKKNFGRTLTEYIALMASVK